MRAGRGAELAALLILAVGTWLGFAASGLPAVIPATAPASVFSADRAMADLRNITRAPHPTGSVEHDRIRDYLVDRLRALGADVHVQSATGFNTLQGPLAATVANVVARKRGMHSGKAVLLSAHYDAVPRSSGAGDDGSGVAAILGTLEVLANGPPLDNDLMVTFVDAEEDGLLGAEAFVNLHPWAKDVGVVLNFDARGTQGPVYMFQTSPGNAALINALAKVPGARTNSLTGEVYRHLPSDTDLSIWLHSKWFVDALNFAPVGGYTQYHTPMDNINSLDPRIVQQMGDYALSLTRTFGSAGGASSDRHDAIYFSAPGLGVVHYPSRWALIISVDAFALVLIFTGFGLFRGTLRTAGVGRGAIALFITLALPAVATLAGWRVITLLHPSYSEILQGDPYNSQWYLLAAAAFTVAVALEVQRRFTLREERLQVARMQADPSVTAGVALTSTLDIAVAPMLLWGILGIAIAATLPGASYLFAWPLFAATLSASSWRRAAVHARRQPWWLALLALPALILWSPLARAFEVALTAQALPLSVVVIALMLSLLVLPLRLLGGLRPVMVKGAGLVAIGALIGAEATASFSDTRKRPDSLAYAIDGDSARAWWVSFDRTADSWTEQALGPAARRRNFDGFGLTRNGGLLSSDSVNANAGASPVHVVATATNGATRRVHLHIDRSAAGESVMVYGDTSLNITQMVINDRVLVDGNEDRYSAQYHTGPDGIVLRYFGVPAEGLDLRFSVAGTVPTALRVMSGVEGLPPTSAGKLPPRMAKFTSKPFVPTDMTWTMWRVKI